MSNKKLTEECIKNSCQLKTFIKKWKNKIKNCQNVKNYLYNERCEKQIFLTWNNLVCFCTGLDFQQYCIGIISRYSTTEWESGFFFFCTCCSTHLIVSAASSTEFDAECHRIYDSRIAASCLVEIAVLSPVYLLCSPSFWRSPVFLLVFLNSGPYM